MKRTNAVVRICNTANNGRGQLLVTIPRNSGFKPGQHVLIYPAKLILKKDL